MTGSVNREASRYQTILENAATAVGEMALAGKASSAPLSTSGPRPGAVGTRGAVEAHRKGRHTKFAVWLLHRLYDAARRSSRRRCWASTRQRSSASSSA
jgi:hypothetical protein